jgi:phenylalanyl-tRNA synthetase alpha chain
MEEKVESIKNELVKDLESTKTIQDVQNLKVKYLGKKGLVTELTANMKDLDVEERKVVGKLSSEIRTYVTDSINSLEEKLKLEELNKKLEKDTIDISLPREKSKRVSRHPFNRIM